MSSDGDFRPSGTDVECCRSLCRGLQIHTGVDRCEEASGQNVGVKLDAIDEVWRHARSGVKLKSSPLCRNMPYNYVLMSNTFLITGEAFVDNVTIDSALRGVSNCLGSPTMYCTPQQCTRLKVKTQLKATELALATMIGK